MIFGEEIPLNSDLLSLMFVRVNAHLHCLDREDAPGHTLGLTKDVRPERCVVSYCIALGSSAAEGFQVS